MMNQMQQQPNYPNFQRENADSNDGYKADRATKKMYYFKYQLTLLHKVRNLKSHISTWIK